MAKPLRKPEAINERDLGPSGFGRAATRSTRANQKIAKLKAMRRRERRVALKRETAAEARG